MSHAEKEDQGVVMLEHDHHGGQPAEWPRAAIIIPAFNEERFIGVCLEGVKELDYPSDHVEIVVVDNGSRDRTREIVGELQVKLLDLPEGFVGAVRNHGVAATDGEYVAFLDSDCVPPRDWLKRAIILLEAEPGIGGVGGICLAPSAASWIERAWAQNPHAQVRDRASLSASSLIMRRRDFSALGGFNEGMSAGEDYEISRRLVESGFRLVALPACAVHHWGWPRSFAEVFRRQVWQGTSQIQAAKGRLDRALLMVHVFLLAPLLTLLLCLASGPDSPWTWLPLSANLAIPALASYHRSRESASFRGRLLKSTHLYPVYWVYYLGRCVGLVKNYLNLILGRRTQAKTWSRSRGFPKRSAEDDPAS